MLRDNCCINTFEMQKLSPISDICAGNSLPKHSEKQTSFRGNYVIEDGVEELNTRRFDEPNKIQPFDTPNKESYRIDMPNSPYAREENCRHLPGSDVRPKLKTRKSIRSKHCSRKLRFNSEYGQVKDPHGVLKINIETGQSSSGSGEIPIHPTKGQIENYFYSFNKLSPSVFSATCLSGRKLKGKLRLDQHASQRNKKLSLNFVCETSENKLDPKDSPAKQERACDLKETLDSSHNFSRYTPKQNIDYKKTCLQANHIVNLKSVRKKISDVVKKSICAEVKHMDFIPDQSRSLCPLDSLIEPPVNNNSLVLLKEQVGKTSNISNERFSDQNIISVNQDVYEIPNIHNSRTSSQRQQNLNKFCPSNSYTILKNKPGSTSISKCTPSKGMLKELTTNSSWCKNVVLKRNSSSKKNCVGYSSDENGCNSKVPAIFEDINCTNIVEKSVFSLQAESMNQSEHGVDQAVPGCCINNFSDDSLVEATPEKCSFKTVLINTTTCKRDISAELLTPKYDLNEHKTEIDCSFHQNESIQKPENFVLPIIQPYETPIKHLKVSHEIGVYNSQSKVLQQSILHCSQIEFKEDATLNKHSVDLNIEDEESDTLTKVANSEQFKLKKKTRPGSLLERAYCIASRMEVNYTLFEYEMHAFLRPEESEKFTNAVKVKYVWKDRGVHYFFCLPMELLRCHTNFVEPARQMETSLIIVANSLSHYDEYFLDKWLTVHLPVTVITDPMFKSIIVLAGNQVQFNEVTHEAQGIEFNNGGEIGNNSILESSEDLMKYIKKYQYEKGQNIQPIVRTLHSDVAVTILDLAVGQLLLKDFDLQLHILHICEMPNIEIILQDEENQFCKCCFSLIDDIHHLKSLLCLKKNLVGCDVVIKGFYIKERIAIDCFLGSLLEYLSGHKVNSSYMYIMIPHRPNWNCSQVPSKVVMMNTTTVTPFLEIQMSRKEFGRYMVKIESVENTANGLLIGDNSSLCKMPLKIRKNDSMKMFTFDRLPVILDAVYFSKGNLYIDNYTRIVKG